MWRNNQLEADIKESTTRASWLPIFSDRHQSSKQSKTNRATLVSSPSYHLFQPFLSDPSPIIVYPCHLLTDWLTPVQCSVNLIDVNLPCEDAKSKLVDVVTLADEDRVGNNLLQISNLRFGQKAKLLFGLWTQGMVKILKLKFKQDLKLEIG